MPMSSWLSVLVEPAKLTPPMQSYGALSMLGLTKGDPLPATMATPFP